MESKGPRIFFRGSFGTGIRKVPPSTPKDFRSRSVDVPKRGPEGLVGQIFWDPVTFLGGTGIFVSKELIR